VLVLILVAPAFVAPFGTAWTPDERPPAEAGGLHPIGGASLPPPKGGGLLSDELGEIEELEMLPPEEPAPAPTPVPSKAPPPAAPRPAAPPKALAAKAPQAKPPAPKTPEHDLDEIIRLLNQ